MIENFRKYTRNKFMTADFNSWTQVFWYIATMIVLENTRSWKIELKGLVESIKDAATKPSRPSSIEWRD